MYYYEHVWGMYAVVVICYFKTTAGRFIGNSRYTTHEYPKSLVWC